MINNKKGSAFSIIVWMVSIVVIIFFLAGWMYFHNVLTNALLNIHLDSNIVNMTQVTQQTFVPINNSMNSLTWISFILIFMLGFSILIENFYVRQHPWLFFVHLLVVLLAIVGSIYISNYYESLMTNPILGSTINQFTISNYVVLYLPYFVAVMGIFGMVLLVINAVRDPEIGRSSGI